MQFDRTNKKDHGAITDDKDHYVIQVAFTETPKPKRQIEILQSPLFYQTKKDLFSQLLGSDAKNNGSPFMLLGWSNKKSEELQSAFKDEDLDIQENMDEEQSSQENPDYRLEHYENQIKEDLLRKRRRKSTAQLKALQIQFDKRQGQWSKQKIIKMAELTGLSESQVYKWCWDHKKKTQDHNKTFRSAQMVDSQMSQQQSKGSSVMRTKFIHKQSKNMRTKKKNFQCSSVIRNESLRKRE